jgi:hypothetical protein
LKTYSFVTSEIDLHIIEDNDVDLSHGIVMLKDKATFFWKISEQNIFTIICSIHSLGYANDELHLDAEKQKDEISVYFVVE